MSADINTFDVPEGWAMASVLSLSSLLRGVSYSSGEASSKPGDGLLPIVRANNIVDSLVLDGLQYVPSDRISEAQLLRRGDVVVAMSSGSKLVVGKAASVREDWEGGFGAFCGLLRPMDKIDPFFFGLFFQTKEYRESISEASAGTNINNLKRVHFEEIEIPLPPLAEQRRIVARVEGLLARVQAARQRLARVPQLLKRFRQAILTAACNGQLTADWAKSNCLESFELAIRKIAEDHATTIPVVEADSDLNGEWVRVTLGFLAEPTLRGRPYVTSGSRGWAKLVGEMGPYFIRSENINTDQLRLDDAVHVDAPDGAEAERTKVQSGDLLLTITGNNVGRTAVVSADCPVGHVSQHVAIIRMHSGIHTEYVWLWMRSLEHGQKQLKAYFYGETKPGLNLEQVKSVWIDLPPLAEQHEIVRRVNALFQLADAIERRVAAATAKADKLTQAILAKAFRGELVPTEADLARTEARDYETAEQLLERIRSDEHLSSSFARERQTRKPAQRKG